MAWSVGENGTIPRLFSCARCQWGQAEFFFLPLSLATQVVREAIAGGEEAPASLFPTPVIRLSVSVPFFSGLFPLYRGTADEKPISLFLSPLFLFFPPLFLLSRARNRDQVEEQELLSASFFSYGGHREAGAKSSLNV